MLRMNRQKDNGKQIASPNDPQLYLLITKYNSSTVIIIVISGT